MKLTLIRPNLADYRSSDAMAPLAMGILAARSDGFDISFYDEKAEALPENDQPDLVALSVETFHGAPCLHRSRSLSRARRSSGHGRLSPELLAR